MKRNLLRIGRALVALIFIVSGLGKIAGFEATREMMAGVGFPMPGLFLVGAILIEVIGGLALFFGYRVQWAAGLLIIFLVLATLIFHIPYLGDQAQSQMQTVQVLKNLAILGALISFMTRENEALPAALAGTGAH